MQKNNSNKMKKETRDEKFMDLAIKAAIKAEKADEVPIGAIIVSGERIIASAGNETERNGDVTAHAEILAITSATEYLGSKYLIDCDLYVTLEPCTMCAGAIRWARLRKVIYGAKDLKAGYSKYNKEIIPAKVEVVSGVREAECQEILSNFFNNKRKTKI